MTEAEGASSLTDKASAARTDEEKATGSAAIPDVLEFTPGDFPGGPVGKTPSSQCRGPEFDPWSGN